ncbi:unnamed protein product [Aureobasidium vineae]|uniref:Uncharacterized protein n=1 Tax=Aureobasidium vineae TaxID=2773715 RepID=A0A9N8JAC3_9PEZI|nr:unnamed protein product [Aureobasidium vineae]
MINTRNTIAPSDHARYDSFMKQHAHGNTMSSYNLIDGVVQIRIVRSKTLEVLAEDHFADNGLGAQFVAEYQYATDEYMKRRANVTERCIYGTPEPEAKVVV